MEGMNPLECSLPPAQAKEAFLNARTESFARRLFYKKQATMLSVSLIRRGPVRSGHSAVAAASKQLIVRGQLQGCSVFRITLLI